PSEKNKLASAMQLAAIAQSQGKTEGEMSQMLDTFMKTGNVEQSVSEVNINPSKIHTINRN
ncbi:MAG: hypothetical protein ACK44E_08940, partial [Anaerolineales bacterium]